MPHVTRANSQNAVLPDSTPVRNRKDREGPALTADERRAVIDRVLAMVRHLPNEDGISAARSQDFLYGDDGLPE